MSEGGESIPQLGMHLSKVIPLIISVIVPINGSDDEIVASMHDLNHKFKRTLALKHQKALPVAIGGSSPSLQGKIAKAAATDDGKARSVVRRTSNLSSSVTVVEASSKSPESAPATPDAV